MKRNRFIMFCLFPLLLLSGEYLAIRYPLFSQHGMQEWPLTLCLVGVAATVLSFLLKAKWTPYLTAVGYGVGFAVGLMLQTDSADPGGGTANNLWLIWTVVFALCIAAAAVSETFFLRRKK